eukprot:TRINITY_DN2887_c9_g1_i1.p1 TRINITY_DN2887_c9_g1~~TRINITY_DN2887_c9_g1_i1.p1  ORF type:complete len:396 (+),score=104.25 TRINITY_DN2887_c9_g1_i1:82-1188(+)
MAQVGPGVGEEPRFTKNGRMMIPVRDAASIAPEEPPVEWHTNSHVHEQELQRMKAERQELNKIEKKAQQRKLETEENARTEEAEILERANKADAFRVVEFAALRERLAEQKENAITLEEETDAKVEELSDEAKAARAQRLDFERQLREEAKKTEEARRRTEEADDFQTQQLCEKDRIMTQQREEIRKEVANFQREMEAKVLQEESNLLEDLKVLHDAALQAGNAARSDIREQVDLRFEAIKSCNGAIRDVDREVSKGLREYNQKVLELQDDMHLQAAEVRHRDYALENLLSQEVHTAVSNMDAATKARARAEVGARDAARRQEGTAEAFGKIFPRSTQFTLHGLPGTPRHKPSPLASSAWSVIGAVAE